MGHGQRDAIPYWSGVGLLGVMIFALWCISSLPAGVVQ